MRSLFSRSSMQSGRTPIQSQRGLTLIELMVAIALGLLVSAALIKVYIDMNSLTRLNEGLARIQENGRFALEFMRRDVRRAGFWGCYSYPIVNPGNTSDIWYPTEELGNLTTGARAFDSTTPISGTEGSDTPNPDLPDTITLRFASESGVQVTQNQLGSHDPLTVASVTGFSVGDIAVVSDCYMHHMFAITAVNAGTLQLSHAQQADYNSDDHFEPPADWLYEPNDAEGTRFNDVRVFPALDVTYCVATGADGSTPVLRRLVNPSSAQTCAANGEELIEGVENMQILYGEDSNDADAENRATRYVPIDEVAEMERVVSIRISLLLRSIENNLTTSPSPYTFEGVTYTPGANDRYLRKAFTTTITLRNQFNDKQQPTAGL